MKSIKLAVVSLCMVSGGALADAFYLDRFEVTRDGSAGWFVDEFEDGVVPPSSEGTFPNSSPGNYLTRPSQLVGPEVGGKLLLDPSAGESTSSESSDGSVLVQSARLQTDKSDDPARSDFGLKVGLQFSVIGTFDLVKPTTVGARYGIRLDDFSSTAADDLVQLRVESFPGNGNDWKVRFFKSGDANSSATVYDELDLNGIANIDEYEQIVLTLTKADAATKVVSASFALVDSDGSFARVEQALNGTATAFNGETWTRAAFFASLEEGLPQYTRLTPVIFPLLLND